MDLKRKSKGKTFTRPRMPRLWGTWVWGESRGRAEKRVSAGRLRWKEGGEGVPYCLLISLQCAKYLSRANEKVDNTHAGLHSVWAMGWGNGCYSLVLVVLIKGSPCHQATLHAPRLRILSKRSCNKGMRRRGGWGRDLVREAAIRRISAARSSGLETIPTPSSGAEVITSDQ